MQVFSSFSYGMHVLPKMMMQDDLHSVDALVGMRPDVMTPTYVQSSLPPGRALCLAGRYHLAGLCTQQGCVSRWVVCRVGMCVATASHASWSE